MEGLKPLWNRIEKKVIYCALSIVLLLEMLSYFIPSISQYYDQRAVIIIFCFTLILLFKTIDEHILKSSKKHLEIADSFAAGLSATLLENKKIDSVDIFARTTTTYCNAIRTSNIKINTLRILVVNPEILDKNNHSRIDEDLWRGLVKQKLIKNLEIKYYDFLPIAHFAIINKRCVHFGMYKMSKQYPGYELFNNYDILGKDAICDTFLTDFKEFFENIYNDHSVPSVRGKQNTDESNVVNERK
ncbi:MAG: hypothetical protein LBC03_06500 [Nitrososphaerota archaeon]|jgi:hypothetical protein|nr:hypothetical protein [Nitrososphaerota archaeon]